MQYTILSSIIIRSIINYYIVVRVSHRIFPEGEKNFMGGGSVVGRANTRVV